MPQSMDSFDNAGGFGTTPAPISEGKFETPVGQSASPSSGNPFGGEKFRGSSELPLTTEGLMKAHQLAMQLARKGGLDRIMASSLGRTMQTAKIISQYTHAPITHIGDELHPWHQGGLEGTPVTQDSIDFMNHLITKEPDLKIPGRGPMSTSDGESFNDFHQRAMPFLMKAISQSRSRPQERTGLVTHYRVRKLLDAWMRAGAPEDGSIDRDEMTVHNEGTKPGSMERLVVDPYTGGPQISNVDLNTTATLPGGLYFIRHEATPWNAKPSGSGGGTS